MNFLSIKSFYKEIKWKLLYKKLSKIEFLILDVDGVLTDGGLYINNNGEILKRFDVKDGLAIKLLQDIGIKVVFLSGGISGATEARAKQLGIQYCFVGIEDKYNSLKNLQIKLKIPISKTAYVGDDINDIVVRPLVKLLFAPLNSSRSLINKSDIIINKTGGSGAIRELAERLLIAKGLWRKLSKNGYTKKNT